MASSSSPSLESVGSDFSPLYTGHVIPVRQALKVMITEKEPLRLTDDRKTFADYNIKMDTHLILRDIGPQVGYRDVGDFIFSLFGSSLGLRV